MRNWIRCSVCVLIIFYSCSTTSVFHSPNHLDRVFGKLVLSGGDTISGKITLNNEVFAHNKVTISNEASSKKIFLHDIAGYQVNGNNYDLRHIMHDLNIGKNLFFMQRLTPDNSPIHLYEHIEKHVNHRSANRVSYQPKYYIQFPNEHRYSVWALNSKRLVPHFHLKMSELLASCKTLADKILQKEEGYFYSKYNASEKEMKDVVLRIINEYNNCTKSVSKTQKDQ